MLYINRSYFKGVSNMFQICFLDVLPISNMDLQPKEQVCEREWNDRLYT
jgi:hypothetical protein